MMTRVARAREFGETRGFIKIMVDADTEEILGAAILGLNGDEAIHCLLDTMYARKPYTVISRAVHIHPTVAELIPTVLWCPWSKHVTCASVELLELDFRRRQKYLPTLGWL